MPNILPGIITIVIAAIGVWISWLLFRRKKDQSALWLLAVAGLALRVFTAGDMYLHEWDERYHALVAKNLIKHPLVPTLYDDPALPYDYRDWTSNHIWLHKQPLPLWGMALSLAIFGANEIAVRLPSILLTTLGIWLVFFIGKYYFDRRTGYLAAFFFAINGLILELAGGRMPTDHIDIFFLFFTELAVFFCVLFVKKQRGIFNILAGISIGLAILSKWLPALIVFPVWLLLVLDSGKFSRKEIISQMVWLGLSSIIVFLPWQIYIHRAFPQEAAWEAQFNWRHITEPLENHTGEFYYFLNRIRINYGELIYLPLAWLIFRLWTKPAELKLWSLAAWFFIPLIFFSAVQTKMQGYLLNTSPVLFMVTAAFFWRLNDWKKQVKYPVLINLLLLLFIALPVRYSIERSKPFLKLERNPEWVKELRNMSGIQTGETTNDLQASGRRPLDAESKTILFNYPRPIEAMFYTDMTVYKTIPDSAVIHGLEEKGYEVLIYGEQFFKMKGEGH